MEFVQEVVHDVTQTLLDHHPSLITIAMQLPPKSGLRRSSYFKLDANELLVESTFEALKLVWAEQMIENHDPRVNWELG